MCNRPQAERIGSKNMNNFKTLKDHVYDYIAARIREGSLLPGQRVNENVICEELDISRTPVREALIQLSAEGVLENKSRKGFVISSMSESDVRDLYEVIGILDGSAARRACDKLTERDFADMEFYIDTIDLAIKAGNFEMYHRQQAAFHQLYIDKCGNKVLMDSTAKAKNKLLKRSYSDDPEGKTREVLFRTNLEHRRILELFKAGDRDELFVYLCEVHWTPALAAYDVLI